MITGKDLLNLGFKSGKWFKEAIAHLNAHALEGDARLAYLRAVGPPAEIPLLPEPAPFYENIQCRHGGGAAVASTTCGSRCNCSWVTIP